MLVNNKPKRSHIIRDHLDTYSSLKLEYDSPKYHSPLRFRKSFTSTGRHLSFRQHFYSKNTNTFRSIEYDLRNEYIEYKVLPLSWYSRVLRMTLRAAEAQIKAQRGIYI